MQLNTKEKNILSIIDDTKVSEFTEYAKQVTDLSEEEIQKIIEKLKDKELVKIVDLNENENEPEFWYFRTELASKYSLNDKLRYETEFGSVKNLK